MPFTHNQRNAVLAGSVLLLHAGGLWALQSGLLRRAVEIVVPVQMLSEMISPPAPQIAPPPPPAPPPPVIHPRKIVTSAMPAPQPPPQPLAIADAAPSPSAPTGVVVPAPVAPVPVAVTTALAPVVAAAPAPAKVELPISDADYLHNPKPAYPLLSKRMGEQGKVVLRVLIGEDGSPQKAEIRTSSGFERLDQAGLATVLKWRYVPGKRGGLPETMWVVVPIHFSFE